MPGQAAVEASYSGRLKERLNRARTTIQVPTAIGLGFLARDRAIDGSPGTSDGRPVMKFHNSEESRRDKRGRAVVAPARPWEQTKPDRLLISPVSVSGFTGGRIEDELIAVAAGTVLKVKHLGN